MKNHTAKNESKNNASYQVMRRWLQQPLGQRYVTLAKEKISSLIEKSFGYHLLIIGEPELATCVIGSPINHHVLVHYDEDSKRNIYSLCCARQDKLPIETESVDIVYLAHCLELDPNPHEILREAYRVLRPEGRLIISGFNPISLFGGWCLVANLFKVSLWPARFITALKLREWLQLLGFSPFKTQEFFYWQMGRLERIACKFKLPFGAAYLIMAYKRVIALTPIKPEWQAKHYAVAEHLAETAKYNITE